VFDLPFGVEVLNDILCVGRKKANGQTLLAPQAPACALPLHRRYSRQAFLPGSSPCHADKRLPLRPFLGCAHFRRTTGHGNCLLNPRAFRSPTRDTDAVRILDTGSPPAPSSRGTDAHLRRQAHLSATLLYLGTAPSCCRLDLALLRSHTTTPTTFRRCFAPTCTCRVWFLYCHTLPPHLAPILYHYAPAIYHLLHWLTPATVCREDNNVVGRHQFRRTGRVFAARPRACPYMDKTQASGILPGHGWATDSISKRKIAPCAKLRVTLTAPARRGT